MTPLERKLHRAAVKSKKERMPGIHNEICIGCAADLTKISKEDDHMAGRKHSDLVWPLCKQKCHPQRSEYQREQRPASKDRRNVFEVIGRWIKCVAEYFELMTPMLHQFGDFLIALAARGYGAELELP